MGLQLIFVVETNKTCKSDWIYIKDTIEKFYTYDRAHVKFSPVYMNGKTNYADKEKEIKTLISQYDHAATNNESKVIYCFDCDDYDVRQEDLNFLKKVRRFCEDRGYAFAWFCKDIERVFLGYKVPDSQKKKEAAAFKAKKMISGIKAESLSAAEYRANKSNLLKILDTSVPPLIRK